MYQIAKFLLFSEISECFNHSINKTVRHSIPQSTSNGSEFNFVTANVSVGLIYFEIIR